MQSFIEPFLRVVFTLLEPFCQFDKEIEEKHTGDWQQHFHSLCARRSAGPARDPNAEWLDLILLHSVLERAGCSPVRWPRRVDRQESAFENYITLIHLFGDGSSLLSGSGWLCSLEEEDLWQAFTRLTESKLDKTFFRCIPIGFEEGIHQLFPTSLVSNLPFGTVENFLIEA